MKEKLTQDCKLSEEQWMEMASSFELQPHNRIDVFINKMAQMDGSIKWSVKTGPCVLTKEGCLEYEPIPSSRTEEYLERARFDSKDEAYQSWLEYIKSEE